MRHEKRDTLDETFTRENVIGQRSYDLELGLGTAIAIDGDQLLWIEKYEKGHSTTWVAKQGITPIDLLIAVRAAVVANDITETQSIEIFPQVGTGQTVSEQELAATNFDEAAVVSIPLGNHRVVWQRSLDDPACIELSLVCAETTPSFDNIRSVMEITADARLVGILGSLPDL